MKIIVDNSENRKCINCDKLLTPREIRRYKNYCCLRCKEGRLPIQKNCIVCNSIILTSFSKQIYCSKSCGAVAVKLRSDDSKSLRTEFSIFERDNFTCIYCGKSSIEDSVKLHVEHITAVSEFGETSIDNLITSCESCNVSKGSIPLSEEVKIRIFKVLQFRNSQITDKQKSDILNQIIELKKMHLLRVANLSVKA